MFFISTEGIVTTDHAITFETPNIPKKILVTCRRAQGSIAADLPHHLKITKWTLLKGLQSILFPFNDARY